jgi:hypothetical protein
MLRSLLKMMDGISDEKMPNRLAGGISPLAPILPGMRVRTRRFPRATEP